MMKNLLAISFGLFFSILAYASNPTQRNCGTMDNLSRLQAEDPGLAARMQQIESATNAYLAVHKNQNTTNTVITIPVVFHIVYNNTAQNISDAKCIAQLNQLNLDFARLNSDASNTPSVWQGISANTNIQFCLAQRTPTGAATTGIERRSTTVTSFSTNDNVKRTANGGMDAWPASSYLNIWSANISGGVLGYAQFPGGPASTDGVVLRYTTIGSMTSPGSEPSYNLGRTATHEVGHWLNLFHIWGDDGTACSGSDQCSDTPNQAGENYGAPAFPRTDACATASPGVMFMNYMDYTDDNAMNMFTVGQSARINALFGTGGSRVGLLTSLGCQAPSTTCGTPSGNATSSITTTGATLSWTAVSGATSYNVQYKLASAATYTSVSTASTSYALTGLASGTAYNWMVNAVCASGTSSNSTVSNFTTTAVATCGTPTGNATSSITTTGATLSWTAVSGATSYNVQYKLASAATYTSVSTASTSYALTGLASGTAYNWRVNAVCASGTSANSTVLNFTTTAAVSCGTPTGLTSSSITTTGVTLGWTAVSGATSYNVQYRLSSSATWTTTTSTTNSKNLIGLVSASAYTFQVQAVCASGSSAYSTTATFTTLTSTSTCSDIYESNNTSGTAKTITTNTDITAMIGSSTDNDYFKFTTTSPNTKIKIVLSNLPFDYDIRLYNSSMTQLSISQNGGTTSETIIRNTTTAATYYIRVYGYNGVFSTTSCYNLRVNVSGTNFRSSDDLSSEVATPIFNDFTVYPNPTHGEVNVGFSSLKNETITVRIFDMVGKTILTNEIGVDQGDNKFSFDLANLTKGIYFVELNNSSERLVKKLIIE
ncbi:MAG: fibronectin type III domain-containing protein [Bacteroidia bacterium]|nr:fibronectin type III domain-containing protein [Bacteroidia bacterium]